MHEGHTSEDPRDVLRYWRLVELFSPQKVKPPDPASPDRPIVAWSRSRPLPWDRLPAPTKPTLRWSHTLYLGVYELESVYEYLHTRFPQARDAYDDRAGGLTACAAVVVDGEGRLAPETAVLSSTAWALAQIAAGRATDRAWLHGFEAAQEQFVAALGTCLADVRIDRQLDEDAPARVDAPFVEALVDAAWSAAGLRAGMPVATRTVHVASVQVRADRAEDATAQDFLNSFHLGDLGLVAEAPWGPALERYLTPPERLDVGARVDVRAQPEVVLGLTGIDRLPSGRWPGNPDHPLASSQQLAVNEAVHGLGPGAGLLGVNGPPGTGKTTLLRDVVADSIVRRAAVLAALEAPDDAFTPVEHGWKAGTYPRKVRQLRDELVGFEMVVASSNNAAVENITDELPRAGAIDERWHGEVDYFTDLATTLSAADGDPDVDVPPAWALIAARLGNAKNRGDFLSAFWFGRGDQKQPHDPARGVVHGLQRLLQVWEREPESRPDREAAAVAFRRTAGLVEELRRERLDAEARIRRQPELAAEQAAAAGVVASLDDRLAELADQADEARSGLAPVAATLARLRRERERHREVKPGWWEGLTSWGAASRSWRAELVRLNAELAELEREHDARDALVHDVEARRAETSRERGGAVRACARLEAEATALADSLGRDEKRFGATYPGPAWLDDLTARELRAPWQDPEMNHARAELLLRALDVHKAFLANVTGVSGLMRASVEVVTGSAPAALDAAARRAAWQMFFLVVPVVSTTFASVARMLHGLGEQALGWLFVDEAGQAAPQEAVGAFWRARRVVAVGDPLQLTPVVSIPRRAQHAIAAHLRLSDTWVPSVTSVQGLVDRVAHYGTELTSGTEPVWVSSPLRVHRRCASPMFEISNGIAYDDLMIHAAGPEPEGFAGVPSSRWLDVTATSPGSHLQRAEIDRLQSALRSLADRGITADQVIAISPFRAVAGELERLASRWAGIRAGTVHRAQGRQAPVVFLVLGGDPASSGALRWASEAPNLLNVAASRAQHRFYVIGDRRRWADLPYFEAAARLLG